MKNTIKWFTLYEVLFLETGFELIHRLTTVSKNEVLNFLEVKNFEVDNELKFEILQDYFYYELKNGTKVPNKKIKVEHANHNYLVVSEFDKDYTKE